MGFYAFFFAITAILFSPESAMAQELTDDAPTVLITGSSRGIGFSLAKQYAERGWRVIATSRNPDTATELQLLAARHSNVVIEKLDVTDLDAIDDLSLKYKETPIDVLLNNAGISGGRDTQKLGELQFDVFDKVMHTNVVGPLKMAEAFLHQVEMSDQKKLVNISSTLGSITRSFGGQYFYRASKSSLNMVMRTLAIEVKERGIIVGLITPGLVATDFTKGLTGIPMIQPEESASLVIAQIEQLTLEKSGMFVSHRGEDLPW